VQYSIVIFIVGELQLELRNCNRGDCGNCNCWLERTKRKNLENNRSCGEKEGTAIDIFRLRVSGRKATGFNLISSAVSVVVLSLFVLSSQ
jgi:hypothetical protein